MREPNHQGNLDRLFASLDANTMRLAARESSTIEFKENFNWANKDRYARTMAAFANNRGGYLIFGVADTPRRLAGLNSQGFELHDEALITGYLAGLFAPELIYEKFVTKIEGLRVGAISLSSSAR